ncbi:MAG: hypothetical protein K2M07_04995 [Muribaculaceae bacterium]|nr:hypothetical protein [Muribaculaceae bacterium]
MGKPNSKERLGSAILLIATWIMIMTVIVITKCGNDHPESAPYHHSTDSITEQADSLASPRDSIPKKKKKKSRKKKEKASPTQPYNPLDHPVSGNNPS